MPKAVEIPTHREIAEAADRVKSNPDAFKKAGDEIMRQAKDQITCRKNWANKELGQFSKDFAGYICDGLRGKATFLPMTNKRTRPKETGVWELIKGKLVKK